MQRIYLFLAITILIPLLASARAQTTPAPETGQFDFWIGNWKCSGESYAANGKTQHTEATNSIKRILGGHVVQESFKAQGFNGTSMSVYVPAAKQWRQTWVDDGGGYIALKGGMADGKMILSTDVGPKGGLARMVFHNISHAAFDWDWEKSSDQGKTWKLAWHLHYTRVD